MTTFSERWDYWAETSKVGTKIDLWYLAMRCRFKGHDLMIEGDSDGDRYCCRCWATQADWVPSRRPTVSAQAELWEDVDTLLSLGSNRDEVATR